MKRLQFRQRVLILALGLVAATQVVTLFPMLDLIKRGAEQQAESTVTLAGTLLDEYLRNRAEQLLTTVNVLVSDYGFKQAVGSRDRATILSALRNHASRVDARVVALLDLDGSVAVSSPPTEPYGSPFMLSEVDLRGEAPRERVVFLDGVPYQTVTVPLRAPVTVGWVLLGFPIDDTLARDLRNLTDLSVSFIGNRGGTLTTFASTLPARDRAAVVDGLDPLSAAPQETGEGDASHLSLVRPFSTRDSGVYVAMHLSLKAAIASYETIRAFFLAIAALTLALAIGGSAWVAKTVTRPVLELVAAARRMREGVYNEPIDVASSDELGELAGSFNIMQHAIADRERQIFHAAHHDSLSGLPNRELSISLLRDLLERHELVSIVSLGIDRFSGIVSSLGHRAGDEVIKLAASALRNRLSEEEVIGHLRAHEFVVALPGRDAREAAEWVEYQCDLLRSGVRVSGANISLQASAGVACFPEHSLDAAELCRRASSARTEALQRHENVAIYRLGQEDVSLRKIKIVGDFPQALRDGELKLVFQPKLDLKSGDIYGVEALVRWEHHELGLLPPDQFVGAIEQAGGIAQLTRWALRAAAERCAAWRALGVRLELSVNISVDDLVDEYLPYFLLEVAHEHRLDPGQLTLEITESAIMHNVNKSLAVANCIHELGFRIAVDDFGTGHSALAQLKRLPVDELKIDKAFVGAHQSPKDEAILRATIGLAHELGLTVVAEGVEDDATLAKLAELGCEHAQGYGIARPMPHEHLLPWLAQRRARASVVPFTPPARRAPKPA